MTESNNTQGWFDALGSPVPYDRRARAIEEARKMGLDLDGDEEMLWMDDITSAIENDRPNKAISKAREKLDITETYLILAYLCVPS